MNSPSTPTRGWPGFQGDAEWSCPEHGPVSPVEFEVLGNLHRFKGKCQSCKEREERREEAHQAAQAQKDQHALNALRGFSWGPDVETGLMVTEGNREAVGTAIAIAKAKRGGLLLVGDVGRGKTEIARLLAWKLWEQDVMIGGWLWPKLLERGREAARGGLRDPFKGLVSIGGLVLDDLAPSRRGYAGIKITDWVVDRLAWLIKGRHRAWVDGAPLVTVLTSTVSIRELGDAYGADIASRLREMCAEVKITGPDRRRRHV